MKQTKPHFASIAALVFIFLILWIAYSNQALELNSFIVESKALPAAFDGYRIAHVSDLHNAEIGENNERLLMMLHNAKPNIIAITGDMIDSRNTSIDVALQFAEEAVKIAPCYYVTGNHESRISDYDELKNGLTALGVHVLEDERMELTHSGESIALIGVNDPSFRPDPLFNDTIPFMTSKLQELMCEKDPYSILLSHRPELFDIYVEAEADLVLSGHAHGGQFRLPFVGGLFAPNQGFLPSYDSGMYIQGRTHMIVSRGIGNSIIPFRINNRPEVILITLKCSQ